MTIIALFFPAFITLKMSAGSRKLSIIDYLFRYCIYTIIINLSIMAGLTYVLGFDGLTETVLQSFSFFIIYTTIACMYAVFVAFFEKILVKNINMTKGL